MRKMGTALNNLLVSLLCWALAIGKLRAARIGGTPSQSHRLMHFDVKDECGNLTRGRASDCKLTVNNETVEYFTAEILRRKYNFVRLKLIFSHFNVNETKYVINKDEWVWTYSGEDGAYQYLYLPGDFGYLSLGLLWTHTRPGSLNVYIDKSGDCPQLVIGEKFTDCLIGEALANMTAKIASQNDCYNSSYWCYNKRMWLESDFFYYACKNAICTFQTFEYNCCKTKLDFLTKKKVLECEIDHYQFGKLWWMFPIIIGNICFAFYPILLSNIGIRINKLYSLKKTNRKKTKERLLQFMARQMPELSDKENSHQCDAGAIISSKHSSPISFMSTMFSPLLRCYLRIPCISRSLRVCIILFPMVLSTIRVCLDYEFAKDVVVEAVRKGALVGFSSIIAGPELARKEFLHIFGGPVVALSIYVAFGCIFILLPPDLERFLEKGLPDYSGKYIFVLRMPLRLKEKLSGCGIRNVSGLKRLHNIMVSQIFMLLHWRFWEQCLRLFYVRWTNVLLPVLKARFTPIPAYGLGCLLILLYMMFCFVELVISVLYFAIPVFSCFCVVLKALILEYLKIFECAGLMLKIVRNIFIIPLFVLFFISWYMFCIIFFDGFWFLSKIAMFTYSGIIAYPRVSYGYLILGLMAFYYLMESFSAFGETYRQLLKLSIECCETFRSKNSNDSDYDDIVMETMVSKRGIRRDLFLYIVDTCKPRRNQIMITLLKFSSVLTILTISVELLKTFDKFQDLSLVSHVFTVLFICALPKIFRVMCMHGYRHRTRKRLKLKIYRAIVHFVRSKSASANDDHTVSNFQTSRDGYESLNDTESD